MILLKGIEKNFNGTPAVEDVSLEVKRGEKCCLVGPTGSGKTTLLRLIAGLEQPDRGEIFIDGRLASSGTVMLPPHQRKIGMVFQNLAVWPHLTVLKHLVTVMNSRVSPRERREKALGILHRMEMGEFAKNYPGMLSGGQKQKLAIARMIAGQPQIALCDEPFAHLDPISKDEVRKIVYQWVEENKITIIVVTHDPLEDYTYFDSVAVMQQGSLVPADRPGARPDFLKCMHLDGLGK